MNLKKLEIQGFKSFAEKTKFLFSDGITVVVGPNGSGKSNIADAIRWVLGEQSMKSLRGGKAEDIIFSGASNRKPLGMAEVSLYLSNEYGKFPIDFSDVKITRRIYRSGESEYLINDAPCRLKDIYDLIADSGLGKDSLAIVGQGMISEILSARAEDRRGIIEEAAGIVRFRNRKREAERKLLDTERNIERIADILDTLSERIPGLEEQKGKAEIFIGLDAQLQQLEKQLILQQVTDAGTRGGKITFKVLSLREELFRKETELRVLDAKLEEKRLHLLQDEEFITDLQQELLTATTLWEKTQGAQKLNQEKMLFINEKIQTVNEAITLLRQNIDLRCKEQQTLVQVLTEKEENHKNLSARLQQAEKLKDENTHELVKLEQQLENSKLEAFEAAQNLSEAKNKLLQIKKDEENLIQKSQMVSQKLFEIRQKLEEEQATLLEIQQQGDEKTKTLQILLINEKALLQKSSIYDQQQKQLETSLRDKQTDTDQVTKQHAFYVEMENKYEGYGHSVRALFEEKAKGNAELSSLHGTVADIMTVDKKYEVAIEIALGAALQNIIVDSDEDAKKAIAFLKMHHAGRATFLPLSSIRPEKGQDLKKYLCASDLIRCDSVYLPVIKFLLARTLVTEDLHTAVSTAKETGHRYKIVTLEGDVIFPGGSISGGSISKKQTSFLSRKRLIDELSQKKVLLLKESLELEAQMLVNKKEIDTSEVMLADEAESIRALTLQIRDGETELKLTLQSIDIAQKNLEEKFFEQKLCSSEVKQNSEDFTYATEEVASKEKEFASINLAVGKFADELLNLKTGQDFNSELLTIKTELARLEEELKNKLSENNALNATVISQKTALENQLRQLDTLTQDKENLEHNINTLNQEYTACSIKRTALENQVQQARETKQHEQMTCFEDEQKLKVLQKQLANQSEEIHVQEMRLAKIETEKELLIERLQNEFEIAFSEADFELVPDFNKKNAQEKITNLQEQIAALGNVNPGAIEEFIEVFGKHEFLSTQHEDLYGAKNSLYKVIIDIEREMSQKFLETFQMVDREFQIVFQQIFAGGNAKLSLTNTDNVLESGIEIVAQPPGKKLQHLMLLSGGEKALTAIALLFAVLRVKPAPFCVLDEIEAALDETNVSRFAAFLKDYSTETQFIIISHRQGTMEVADTLYGTTMEEQGVTKLISVKFDERMVV